MAAFFIPGSMGRKTNFKPAVFLHFHSAADTLEFPLRA
jgi:hypothetical protein